MTRYGSASFADHNVLTLLLYEPRSIVRAAALRSHRNVRLHGATGGRRSPPFSLAVGVTSQLLGRFATRIGPRLPLTIGPIVVATGFALLTRIGADGSYWTGVLPAMIVISIGMAGVVVPLTTAVLASVDERQRGRASGLNSAMAQIGGLVATASISSVLDDTGAALLKALHTTALIGTAAALASAACAFLLLGREGTRPSG